MHQRVGFGDSLQARTYLLRCRPYIDTSQAGLDRERIHTSLGQSLMNSGHNFLKLTDDLVIGQLVPGIVVALIDQNCARLVAKSDSIQIVQYVAHHAATEASGYY